MIKWVAILAFLTVLLALIGTIIIVTDMNKGDDKEIRKDEKKTQLPNLNVDTQIKPQPQVTADSPTAPPPMVVQKKDTPAEKVLSAEKENQEKAVTSVPKIEEKKTVKKRKTEKNINVKKKQENEIFSQQELQQLLSRVYRAKERYATYSNCVQIFITEQSNDTRRMSQVENYLRSRNFSIAGREVIPKKVKGIQITPAGGCLRITIGS